MPSSDSSAAAAVAGGRANPRPVLTRVAWWAILLGLVMEALLLLLRLDKLPELQPLAESLGKVTWSLLVCLGLGVGKVLSEDKAFWMGLAGLVSAPVAFTAAQAVQRAVTELTSSVEAAPMTADMLAVAALRGVEYLILGAILAVLAQRKSRPRLYLAAGLAVGVVFGCILLFVTPAAVGSLAELLGWAVNELLFPMGCALVLYGAGVIGKTVGVN
jgi:hypothetical protein